MCICGVVFNKRNSVFCDIWWCNNWVRYGEVKVVMMIIGWVVDRDLSSGKSAEVIDYVVKISALLVSIKPSSMLRQKIKMSFKY